MVNNRWQAPDLFLSGSLRVRGVSRSLAPKSSAIGRNSKKNEEIPDIASNDGAKGQWTSGIWPLQRRGVQRKNRSVTRPAPMPQAAMTSQFRHGNGVPSKKGSKLSWSAFEKWMMGKIPATLLIQSGT